MNDDILNGLCDGTFRARWLREVLRSPQITESIKLLLAALAVGEMDAAGRVSVPREELAARIGRGKARISERLQEAVQRGFLVRASSGKKGNTAVYLAALDGSACADPIEDEDEIKGPPTRTESGEKGSAYADPKGAEKGPPARTRTKFGSDLQDALKDDQNNLSVRTAGRFDSDDSDSVRVGGPKDEIKGPPTRAAKVVGGVGEVELPDDSTEDSFLKTEDAASRRASPKPKRPKKPAIPKIPLPPDFAPDDAMLAWARQKCPLVDIDAQNESFIIHFTPEPDEPPVTRPGWSRTWKSWMARQQGWAKERHSNVHQLRPTGTGGYKPFQNPADPSVYYEDM